MRRLERIFAWTVVATWFLLSGVVSDFSYRLELPVRIDETCDLAAPSDPCKQLGRQPSPISEEEIADRAVRVLAAASRGTEAPMLEGVVDGTLRSRLPYRTVWRLEHAGPHLPDSRQFGRDSVSVGDRTVSGLLDPERIAEIRRHWRESTVRARKDDVEQQVRRFNDSNWAAWDHRQRIQSRAAVLAPLAVVGGAFLVVLLFRPRSELRTRRGISWLLRVLVLLAFLHMMNLTKLITMPSVGLDLVFLGVAWPVLWATMYTLARWGVEDHGEARVQAGVERERVMLSTEEPMLSGMTALSRVVAPCVLAVLPVLAVLDHPVDVVLGLPFLAGLSAAVLVASSFLTVVVLALTPRRSRHVDLFARRLETSEGKRFHFDAPGLHAAEGRDLRGDYLHLENRDTRLVLRGPPAALAHVLEHVQAHAGESGEAPPDLAALRGRELA